MRVHEAFGRWEMMLHQRQTDKTANGTPKRRGLGRGLLGLFGGDFPGDCVVSSEFISLTCSATISVECCHLAVAKQDYKITQEEIDRWLYKLHLITSAIAGQRALMINCVAEEGMKGYFLEKNRPSTRNAFVRKSRRGGKTAQGSLT